MVADNTSTSKMARCASPTGVLEQGEPNIVISRIPGRACALSNEYGGTRATNPRKPNGTQAVLAAHSTSEAYK